MAAARAMLLAALATAWLVTAAWLAVPAHGASPRVVGGHDAPAGSFGAVADVALGGNDVCSGTLIASEWVMTAAHCASVTGR